MANPILSERFSCSRWTRIATGCVAVVFAAVLFPADRLIEARPQLSGLVESPPLLGFDRRGESNSLFNTSLFTYTGYTNVSGLFAQVEISVLKQGSGLADLENDDLWQVVAVVRPSVFPFKTASGERRFRWSVRDSGQFFFLRSTNPWNGGGVARLRFKARFVTLNGFQIPGDKGVLLPVRDEQGFLGQSPMLVLADTTPNPTEPLPTDLCAPPEGEPPTEKCDPSYLSRKSIKFPTSSERTQEEETTRYYQRAFIDPQQNISILDGIPDLQQFRQVYFGPITPLVPPPFVSSPSCVLESTPETVVTYYNKGDLGLGREMHCIDNRCLQELACYVKNFGGVDTKTVPPTPVATFGSLERAAEALARIKPFATVAMVERGWMTGNPPNKVIFLVFDEKDQLSTRPVQLDNKGFNTFNPGNCLVCHGIDSTYNLADSTVTGAHFLPFDLQAFDYFSKNPTNPLSRAYQEPAFLKLNRAIYFSDLFFLPAARELIRMWYASFHRSTFRDDQIPKEWSGSDNDRQLYLQVIAKACRTCHISATNVVLDFGTAAKFKSTLPEVVQLICGKRKVMPQAEQTIKILWNSSARAHLLNRTSSNSACDYEVQERDGYAVR